ncbi:hypothetical protein EDD11_002013 [Mortierella claussenii]|nr:hypothetical protein EDD11_002013 [Mortierella claussenii]
MTKLWQTVRMKHETLEVEARTGVAQTNSEPFILFRDIKEAFPDAIRLQCGKRVVPFMVDSEGIRSEQSQRRPFLQALEAPSASRLANPGQNNILPLYSHLDGPLLVTPEDVPDYILKTSNEELKSHYRICIDLYKSFAQYIRAGLIKDAEEIKHDFSRHAYSLEAEMTRNPDLKGRIVGIRLNMVLMQQQSLHRAALIQEQVRVFLSKSLETHEYPVPRLFIILPKKVLSSRHVLSEPTVLTMDSFRVHFLCECTGKPRRLHRSSSRSSVRSVASRSASLDEVTLINHIHLSAHDGHDIDKPEEFFRQFGGHMLRLLNMLKYGVDAAGFSVPGLVSAWLSGANHGSTSDLESAVDKTIEYLQELLMQAQSKQQGSLGSSMSEKSVVVTVNGSSPILLKTFLRGVPEDGAVGDLFRIVTVHGHAKWVCRSHYRDHYNTSLATKELKILIAIDGGSFDEHCGRIEISILTATDAGYFYKALEKARSVQELKLTLRWDVTYSEMKALKDTIYRCSHIAVLELACLESNSAAEVLYRNKRAEPLWKMITAPSLRCFSLKGYSGFFKKMTTNAEVNQLRKLSIGEEVDWDVDSAKIVELLTTSQRLVDLTLVTSKVFETYQRMSTTILQRFPNLQKLTIEANKDERLVAHLDEPHRLIDMRVTIPGWSKYTDFILQNMGCISFIHISSCISFKNDSKSILDFIRECHTLEELQISCYICKFSEIYEAIRMMALETLDSDNRTVSTRFKKLTLYRGKSRMFTSDISDPEALSMELMDLQIHRKPLLHLIDVYGYKLIKLRIDQHRWQAVHSIAFLESIARASLTASSSCLKSSLTHLYLAVSDVDVTMLDGLGVVINSSDSLQVFELSVNQSFKVDLDRSWQWAEFIKTVRSKMTLLRMHCHDPEEWIDAMRVNMDGSKQFQSLGNVVYEVPENKSLMENHIRMMDMSYWLQVKCFVKNTHTQHRLEE